MSVAGICLHGRVVEIGEFMGVIVYKRFVEHGKQPALHSMGEKIEQFGQRNDII